MGTRPDEFRGAPSISQMAHALTRSRAAASDRPHTAPFPAAVTVRLCFCALVGAAASLLAPAGCDLSHPLTLSAGFVVCHGCPLSWPLHHHARISGNIVFNYRKASVLSAVNYINVRQNNNRLAEPSVLPRSKTRKPSIDFHEAVYSAFYLFSPPRDGE